MHHHLDENNRIRHRRHRHGRGLIAAAALALSQNLAAVEVAGVEVPQSVTVAGKQLSLNGAGLRSKFFVRIYVGALYLSAAGKDDPEAVYQSPGPRRVAMHVILDELPRDKIRAAWSEGFAANTDEVALATLESRIQSFNALWPKLVAGDRADVDFLPGKGVEVSVNGTRLGLVPGDDFAAAVMRIWLGDDPADSDLKRGMLGGDP